MKEKTIWHPATEFPESGAYVLVVYNGRLREQTVNQKILADFFETSHGDHAMAVGHFHPTFGDALDKRTQIPEVKYPKRTRQTNAAIVDQIGGPIDSWQNVKCWAYGKDIFALIPKPEGKKSK